MGNTENKNRGTVSSCWNLRSQRSGIGTPEDKRMAATRDSGFWQRLRNDNNELHRDGSPRGLTSKDGPTRSCRDDRRWAMAMPESTFKATTAQANGAPRVKRNRRAWTTPKIMKVATGRPWKARPDGPQARTSDDWCPWKTWRLQPF